MKSISLQNMYRSTNENTMAMWAENAGIGEIREENYYDPLKLALAAGIRPPASFSVSHLISELKRLTKDDPLADILPISGFHFTFLPLTLPLYNLNELLPAKVDQLTNIWTEFHAKKIVIRNLRLITLPSQLLLAGIPESPAIALRQSFCEKVLDSHWKNEPFPLLNGVCRDYRVSARPQSCFTRMWPSQGITTACVGKNSVRKKFIRLICQKQRFPKNRVLFQTVLRQGIISGFLERLAGRLEKSVYS